MRSQIHRLAVMAAMLFVHAFGLAQPAAPAGNDIRSGTFYPLPADVQIPRQPRDATAPSAAPNAGSGLPAISPIPMPAPSISPGGDYKIGPNDLLEIDVMHLEQILVPAGVNVASTGSRPRTVRVNAAGAITLPLVGAIVVAGRTALQAEETIAARYGEKYLQNPQVSVFIKEFTTERITVEGAVVKPGIYPLQGQMTLLRALALAGGFGPIANSSEVMLFRTTEKGEKLAAVFDVEKIRAGQQEDPSIRGEDLIVVQRDASRRVLKDSLFRDILDSLNPFSIFR